MDFKAKFSSLQKQAMLYRSQGLLREAADVFGEMRELVSLRDEFKNKNALVNKLDEQINKLDREMKNSDAPEKPPEFSVEIQDTIKNLFAFSDDPDLSVLEGGIVLAKFGQIDRARKEFESLLCKPKVKVAAAKNIIRCHAIQFDWDMAVTEYEGWSTGTNFTPDELSQVRGFLSLILSRAGVECDFERTGKRNASEKMPLTAISSRGASGNESDVASHEVLDISAIEIYMENNLVELDVSFQAGNILSFLIPCRNTALIDFLESGRILKNIQFFSDVALFEGTATVTTKKLIEAGPRQGDYCVDISFSANGEEQ